MKPITHPLAIAAMEAAAQFHTARDHGGRCPTPTAVDAARHAWRVAGCPLYATEPPPGMVEVRVAVAVGHDGRWCAEGCDNQDFDPVEELKENDWLADDENDRLTWITAYVPLPEPAAEVAGEVEP